MTSATQQTPPLSDDDILAPLADDLLIDAEADDPSPAPPPEMSRWLIIGGLVMVALNLRPALSSLAPVLPEVIADTGITATTASILTTAPVLCLGLFGAMAPHLARRYGAERTVLALLLVLAVGVGVRGLATFPALLVGSVLAGAGIGIVNVLLPGLVKRDFPNQAATMTGVYTMALCAGAAVASGATVPLGEISGGWWWGLAWWTVPVLIAVVVWFPLLPRRTGAPHTASVTVRGLWRSPLAWQVTLYMGLQSSLAYSTFGWLAPILRDRGETPVMAGLIVSGSVMVQVGAALAAPIIANRCRDQRGVAVTVVAFSLAGLMGCIYGAMDLVWVWAVLLGIGQGASFATALTLIVMRSADSHVAAHLSGMSQSVGYTLAAGGPLMVGLLHDWFGGWHEVGILFASIAIVSMVFGLGAGRALQVEAVVEPRR